MRGHVKPHQFKIRAGEVQTYRAFLQVEEKPECDSVTYPCDQCDFRTSHKGDLHKHIKSKHWGVKYPCDQCNYRASQKAHLATHIESRHKGVKYPCDQSDFKGSQKANLLTHIKA